MVSGRVEKMISFVLLISSAISADDTPTVGAQPKSKNIIGPYFLDGHEGNSVGVLLVGEGYQ